MLQLLMTECKHVIASGRAYWIAMPASVIAPALRVPTRVRRFNAALGKQAEAQGFHVLDAYHWTQARPEGTEDGTHYGAWCGGPLMLSRTTVDLFLNALFGVNT